MDKTGSHLFEGAGASVTIEIAQVSNVLTVPSSAVRTLGTLSTVSVLKNGQAVITRVNLGTVGTDRTQITSGVTAGEQVVLADLKTPLPSGNATGSTRRFATTTGGAFGRGG
jgi:hypothetical protein